MSSDYTDGLPKELRAMLGSILICQLLVIKDGLLLESFSIAGDEPFLDLSLKFFEINEKYQGPRTTRGEILRHMFLEHEYSLDIDGGFIQALALNITSKTLPNGSTLYS